MTDLRAAIEALPRYHVGNDETPQVVELSAVLDLIPEGNPPTVACDRGCGALKSPATLEEYQAALEHWKDHSTEGGCSHAC